MSPYDDAVKNPSYKAVCTGETTHVEVLHMLFDNRIVSYQQVIEHFFTFHDPTTLDK